MPAAKAHRDTKGMEVRMRRCSHDHDRRRSIRVRATGRVVIHGKEHALGPVVDVSATGVRTRIVHASERYCTGDRVRLELRLDGARGTWADIDGGVVRAGPRDELVIALDDPPTDFEDGIQAELLAIVESEAALQVLLVDPRSGARAQLAAALRGASCMVIEAATPLEAIAYLADSRVHPRLLVIADTTPASVAEELRAFMSAEHDDLRIIRMCVS
jgi:hypothetical protein